MIVCYSPLEFSERPGRILEGETKGGLSLDSVCLQQKRDMATAKQGSKSKFSDLKE